MIGRGLYVGNCEPDMISIWVVHEMLDTYICVCGHEYGMSNNGPWWLVTQWHGIGMRGSIFTHGWKWRVGIDLTCDKWGLVMDVVWSFYAWCMCLFLSCLYMLVSGQYVIPWSLWVRLQGRALVVGT